eukprot:SAG31_NODE_2171_length_6265_cov_3.765326_5_plen_89_part_00
MPGSGLQRTALGILAEGTSHPLAERLDLTRTGAGSHTLEWNAPEHEAGVDIDVDALEGAGEYHLTVSLPEMLSLLNPAVELTETRALH